MPIDRAKFKYQLPYASELFGLYQLLLGWRAARISKRITDGAGINGVVTGRDGGDVEDRMRLGQGALAGVVAERAFVAQRLARVNVAFDDEVGVGGDHLFRTRQKSFKRA